MTNAFVNLEPLKMRATCSSETHGTCEAATHPTRLQS